MPPRRVTNRCPDCGERWTQDWEDPDECPRCGWPYSDDSDDESKDEDTDTEEEGANYVDERHYQCVSRNEG